MEGRENKLSGCHFNLTNSQIFCHLPNHLQAAGNSSCDLSTHTYTDLEIFFFQNTEKEGRLRQYHFERIFLSHIKEFSFANLVENGGEEDNGKKYPRCNEDERKRPSVEECFLI